MSFSPVHNSNSCMDSVHVPDEPEKKVKRKRDKRKKNARVKVRVQIRRVNTVIPVVKFVNQSVKFPLNKISMFCHHRHRIIRTRVSWVQGNNICLTCLNQRPACTIHSSKISRLINNSAISSLGMVIKTFKITSIRLRSDIHLCLWL